MEEESVYNSFPELKEFENKIGRKTPNVILRWMKDAAHLGEESSECLQIRENGTRGECLNDKINHLKYEMVSISFLISHIIPTYNVYVECVFAWCE